MVKQPFDIKPGSAWNTLFIKLTILSCLLSTLFAFPVECKSSRETGSKELQGVSMEWISINGIKVSYATEGEGMPILLIHGVPTSSFLWRKIIREITPYAKVYALDLPGFGHSDPLPAGDYSISSYADVINAFVEKLSLKQVTLVCHDFGGPIAVTFALKHPDKYTQLIILNTFLHNNLPPLTTPLKVARIRPLGEILFWFSGRAIIEAGLKAGVVDKSVITEGIVDRYYSPGGSTGKTGRSFLGMLRLDLTPELGFIERNLKTIDKRTLIIWAENDDYLPIHLGEKIHADMSDSTFIRIPNCGHFLQEECSNRVSNEILEFIR